MKIKSVWINCVHFHNMTISKFPLVLISCVIICQYCFAQKITHLASRPGISIRGLSVLDDDHAWVSGTKGTIGQTENGGKSWKWIQVPGYENRDFRDIELIDAHTALVMAIDTPALILRTTDKGLHWEKVLEDQRTGMFLDAMSIKGTNGIVIGDPIDGHLYLAETKNTGKTWTEIKTAPLSNNGCFASSGTNIVWKNADFLAVVGGMSSTLYWSRRAFQLPLTKGKETTGANSIAIYTQAKQTKAVIVGGDFNNKNSSDSNCVLIPNTFFQKPNPELLTRPVQNPKGYKSCVIYIDAKRLVATGTSGTDISYDEGYHWSHFSDQPFHVIQKSTKGKLILLAGPNGTISKLEL